MKAYLTVGMPASGKSTWAEAQENFVNINLDDCRAEVSGDATNQLSTVEAVKLQAEKIYQAGLQGKDIIISDTNLNPTYRDLLVKDLVHQGFEVELVFFPISLELAKERNSKRSRQVPENILEKMYNSFQEDKSVGLITVGQTLLPKNILLKLNQLHTLKLISAQELIPYSSALEEENLITQSGEFITPGPQLKEFLHQRDYLNYDLLQFVNYKKLESFHEFITYDNQLIDYPKYLRQLFTVPVSEELLETLERDLKFKENQIKVYFNEKGQLLDMAKVSEIIQDCLKEFYF